LVLLLLILLLISIIVTINILNMFVIVTTILQADMMDLPSSLRSKTRQPRVGTTVLLHPVGRDYRLVNVDIAIENGHL
jgi:hypothetical protein